VKPVVLGGVQIARATLNNFTWLTTLGMRVGSRIAIVRSGDVIPKITDVLNSPIDSSAVIAPRLCPSCDSVLVAHMEEDSMTMMHWCESDKCPGRIRDYLIYVADRTVLEIDGLGPEIASLLNRNGVVTSLSSALPDLFVFQEKIRKGIATQGLEYTTKTFESNGYPGALTLRMIESLEKTKRASWPVWIAAMSIPMIGRRLGKVIATQLSLQPDDFPSLPAKVAAIQIGQIDGLGVSKLGELHRYANSPEWIILCRNLHDLGVRPTATVSTSTGVR
jgi:DNA ligase (NAD+)